MVTRLEEEEEREEMLLQGRGGEKQGWKGKGEEAGPGDPTKSD